MSEGLEGLVWELFPLKDSEVSPVLGGQLGQPLNLEEHSLGKVKSTRMEENQNILPTEWEESSAGKDCLIWELFPLVGSRWARHLSLKNLKWRGMILD